MGADGIVSSRDADGVVRVWVAGWEVVFPRAESEEPTASRAEPPGGEAGEVTGVRVARIGERFGVRFGDRMALVSEDGVEPTPIDPSEVATGRQYRLRYADRIDQD